MRGGRVPIAKIVEERQTGNNFVGRRCAGHEACHAGSSTGRGQRGNMGWAAFGMAAERTVGRFSPLGAVLAVHV